MTLFVVQAEAANAAALEQASFIPDGFSWPAVVFGPFWLLYRRLWLALAVWLAIEATFFFLVTPNVGGQVSSAVDALAHLLLGFEGNRLRQQKRARTAGTIDIVEARTVDEAEIIFYRRHVTAEARA